MTSVRIRLDVWCAFLGLIAFGANTQAETIKFDLISPSNCELKANYLINCRLGPSLLETPIVASSPLPLKSMVTVITSGNCSTQFPVTVKIKSERDLSEIEILAVRPSTSVLRTLDRKSIDVFSILDATGWSSKAVFDKTCRSHLEIQPNLPDFASSAEALSRVRGWVEKLKQDTNLLSVVTEYHAYRGLFRVLYELSQSFVRKLTQDSALSLQAHRDTLIPIMESVKLSSEICPTETQRLAVRKLEEFLDDLPFKERWEGKDLTSYFNETDREWITRFARFAVQENSLNQDMLRLAESVNQGCADLFKMKEQLNELLSDKHWNEFADVLRQCQTKR